MIPPIPQELYEQLVEARIPADEYEAAQAVASRAADLLAGALIPATVVTAIHDREDALMDLARLREEAVARVSYEIGFAAGRASEPEVEDAVASAVASMLAAEDPGRAYRALIRGLTGAMAVLQEEARSEG